jgi:uncharacterized protein YggE
MSKRLLPLLLIAGFAACALGQTIQVNQNNRTIAVTANDKATAEADVATVHIGFELFAADADNASNVGSQASNAIIEALQKSGVDDKAIESERQSLRRNTQFDDKDSEPVRANKQFLLTQSWTVKCSAADAARVLNIAVEAGANSSGQIDWGLKDPSALQAQAAAKALIHARAMADQMAKGMNAHLGALIYASNEAPERGGVGYALGALGSGLAMRMKTLPLAIRPQKIQESATVYAVFAIE